MSRDPQESGLRIGRRTFISTAAVLLAVMLAAGILTRLLPQGSYDRVITDEGYELVADGSYRVVQGSPLPVWRWFTAPFEVFASSDSVMAVAVILFLVFIGGTFLVLELSGVMSYVMAAAIRRFGSRKYILLAAVVFISMLLGSTMGMFEETAPLVPIVVALSLALGWDSFVGLGMSILAVGFGFAVGVFNPFSVGVAQNLAGLPLFSGFLFRILIFLVIYGILVVFLILYAKKIEKQPEKSALFESDARRREKFAYSTDSKVILQNRNVRRAALIFGGFLSSVFVYILLGLFIPGLSDYALPVMTVLTTAGGLIAGKAAKYRERGVLRDFGRGMLSILPGTVFIVMAMSAKQIVVAGGIMDTILYRIHGLLQGLSPYAAVLMLYIFVLVMELFISSASAKAFLIMPLIVPLADLIGLTRQTAVQAYAFGDGFSNVLLPTNALLLIVLGMIDIPYGKWLRWTWKLQLLVFLVTAGLLCLAVKLRLGPF